MRIIGVCLRNFDFSGAADISCEKEIILNTDFEILERKLAVETLSGIQPEVFVTAQPRLSRDFKNKSYEPINDISVEVQRNKTA